MNCDRMTKDKIISDGLDSHRSSLVPQVPVRPFDCPGGAGFYECVRVQQGVGAVLTCLVLLRSAER